MSNNTLQSVIDIPTALSFDDVLLIPQQSSINSRSEIDLSTSLAPKVKLKIPLIATKMDKVTGVEMAIKMGKLGGLAILPRFDTAEIQAQNVAKVKKSGIKHIAAAIGCTNGYLQRAEMLVMAGVNILHNDVAHGHLKKNIEAIAALKNKFGDKVTLMPGIAATYECAVDMYRAGADCISSGVGSGSICITRINTGCGMPGFQSLLEIAKAAKEFKRTFIPEAGIRNSGDIVKALATGACAIMAGSIFAGTDEAPGNLIEINDVLYKQYNGAASEAEKVSQIKKDSVGKSAVYIKHIEGVEALVHYKGPVDEVILKLLAGVRSGFSYCGARNITELWSKAKFVRITPAGHIEGQAHDVAVLKH